MSSVSGSGAGGAVPIITVMDYLKPEINRPDMFERQAYSIAGGGGEGLKTASKSIQRHRADDTERSATASLYYTIGLIVVSALVFLSIAAWANTLLSWLDSIYVSPTIQSVTKARLYFAIIMTIIAIVVIALLFWIWYHYTVHKGE